MDHDEIMWLLTKLPPETFRKVMMSLAEVEREAHERRMLDEMLHILSTGE